MAFFPTVTIGANSYYGIKLGEYVLSSTDADQPTTLIIEEPKVYNDKRSYISVALRELRNSPLGGPDEVAQVRVSFNWDPMFEVTDLSWLLSEAHTFLTTADNLARLVRRER